MILLFTLHVIGYDLWFYLSHLLLHTQYMWKYHKIHHKVIYPTYADTYKGHILEGPFQSIGFLLPYIFTEFNIFSSIAALLFVNLRGVLRHDDRSTWLIGNHHILHHQHYNCNYGEYWLDKVCGTLIKDKSKIKKGLLYY